MHGDMSNNRTCVNLRLHVGNSCAKVRAYEHVCAQNWLSYAQKLWLRGRPTMSLAPETVLRGHTGEVQAVTYANHDACLVSGDASGTVRVWGLDSARSQATLAHAEDAGVTQVCVASDNVLTQGRDGEVKLWKMHPDGSLSAGRNVLHTRCYHYCKCCIPHGNRAGDTLGQHTVAVAGEDNKGIRVVDWRTSRDQLVIAGCPDHGISMSLDLPDTRQPLLLSGCAHSTTAHARLLLMPC
jgi:WD40 repeat protein